MHYRHLLAAVETAAHAEDISPTGVHARYYIYYIHNVTINSNCRSCVCRSQSQCRKEFKKLTSCSRDAHTHPHTHTSHRHTSYIRTTHTHPQSLPTLYRTLDTVVAWRLLGALQWPAPLPNNTCAWARGEGEGLWPSHNIATQNTWTRRSSGSKLVFCLSYFTSFIGFYWQRHLNVSKRHLRCCRDRCW